ncbi:MAG TPA: hypothetical protein VMZ71_13635, partial [Gemmataceae bacterium]|nr:hypothetical protein [Gemmataceae bacterium]
MDELRPIPFKVENRSDRVYVFGFLRMLPAGMWLGGIVLIVYLAAYVKASPEVLLALTVLVLIGPILIDRSTLLDPVDSVT